MHLREFGFIDQVFELSFKYRRERVQVYGFVPIFFVCLNITNTEVSGFQYKDKTENWAKKNQMTEKPTCLV